MAFRAVHSAQMGLMRIGFDVLRRFGELFVAHVALQTLRLDSPSVFGWEGTVMNFCECLFSSAGRHRKHQTQGSDQRSMGKFHHFDLLRN